jgi:hypothetical protein
VQTNQVTIYTVAGNVGDANQQDNINIQLTSAAGATDSSALAVANAIQSITWPAGITCSVYVSKVVQTSAVSTGNLSATPPAFI